jgi:rubrerythrin
MTREEKISRLKDILSEINENDNAVCYLTSEDNELIESAIEALEQEPCEDAISRKEALEALEQEEPLVWCDGADEIAAYNQWSSDVDTIKNIPSVQPKPKTGHWEPMWYGGYADGCPVWEEWDCSECGYEHNGLEDTLTNYCPNCGAKMESEES